MESSQMKILGGAFAALFILFLFMGAGFLGSLFLGAAGIVGFEVAKAKFLSPKNAPEGEKEQKQEQKQEKPQEKAEEKPSERPMDAEGKPAFAPGEEPEHFHDNDALAEEANVFRNKARQLRDDAHKPENRDNKGQLLDEADAEDAKASKLIFETLQKKQPEGTIDLHLQFVKEAVAICDEQLKIARDKGLTEMTIIVGRGNHSEGGVCKIAPAVEEWAEKNGLQKQESKEGQFCFKI